MSRTGNARQPGTPRLLRALNDRTALELLISEGPLTRTRLGELTGLSKVTASQLVERLEQRGLVTRVGEVASGRGPSAQLYAVEPRSAYAVGVEVTSEGDWVRAACVDITGHEVGRAEQATGQPDDPVAVVTEVVSTALARGQVAPDEVRRVVVGTPGLVDPATGDVSFVYNLPRWHTGLLPALGTRLQTTVVLENDVNLAAVAEAHAGAAAGHGDFALFWLETGIGMASMSDGRLHRGTRGAAGEIGFLPVALSAGRGGVLRKFAGLAAVRELAAAHGFDQPGADGVRAAVDAGQAGAPLLDELAHRLAVGVGTVALVTDPPLVVLAGALGRAGGEALARRVQDQLPLLGPIAPTVLPSAVAGEPVLAGALQTGVSAVRDEVFGATTG